MSVFPSEQKETIQALLSRKGFMGRQEGLVDYLYQRGYLLQEGTNEYRQVQTAIHQQRFRTDRLELILLASEDCNFRCRYCYEEFARGTMLPEIRQGIKNLVKSRLQGMRVLQIGWFGGEPLYGWDAIKELAPFFQETAQKNGLSFSNHMTTNGYLLSPDVADKLLDWHINRFQITIDGPPETHDHNRPARNGQGTFDRIFSNLTEMSKRQAEFQIGVRVNYDRDNLPHLESLLDRLEKKFQGDSRFQMMFRAVGHWGGANDDQVDICGRDEVKRAAQDLKAAARQRGLQVGTLKNVNFLGGQVCYAARPYHFIIGATGKVMKCTIDLDMKERNVVGSLDKDGKLTLDHDRMAMWTEPAFENDSKCQKCTVLPLCQGSHCPQIRLDHNTSPCSSTRSNAKAEILDTARRTKQPRTKLVAPATAKSQTDIHPQ